MSEVNRHGHLGLPAALPPLWHLALTENHSPCFVKWADEPVLCFDCYPRRAEGWRIAPADLALPRQLSLEKALLFALLRRAGP